MRRSRDRAPAGAAEWATPAVTDIYLTGLAWAFLQDQALWLKPEAPRQMYREALTGEPPELLLEQARAGDPDAYAALQVVADRMIKQGVRLPKPVSRFVRDRINGAPPNLKRGPSPHALRTRYHAIARAVQYVHGLGYPVAWNPTAAAPPAGCACVIVSNALLRFDIDLSADSVLDIYKAWRCRVK